MSSLPTRAGGRHRCGHTVHVPRRDPRPGAPRSRAARAAVVGVTAAAATSTLAGPALAEDADSSSSSTEQTPAAKAAHAEPLVPGTPCTTSTRACVDLESQRAWLIEDGEVTRGPMRIASGGHGEETPVGHSFRVYRQDEDHVSRESTTRDGRPAPMPYSTFFADGGVAFHAGDPARASAGCIRMETDDARILFGELEKGDKVQVVNASEEKAARARA